MGIKKKMKSILAAAAVVSARRLMHRVADGGWTNPDYTPTAEDMWAMPADATAWAPETLPACPEGVPHDRMNMPDHLTHAVKYPYVGATCVFQVSPGSFQIMPI